MLLTAKRPALDWAGPFVAYAVAVLLGAFALYELAGLATSAWAQQYAYGNGDLVGYLEGARRFLATGSPYEPSQLAPWHLQPHSFIHPPVALLLFVPFLWLPSVLWWVIPIVGTAWLIGRPSPYRLLWIAACLAWPRSAGSILAGNTDLWAMLFVAAGVRYGWPFVLLIVKPTFGFLALPFLRRIDIWAIGAVLAVSVPFLLLWMDWITVIRGTDLTPGYSLLNLPLVALPLWRSTPSSERSDRT